MFECLIPVGVGEKTIAVVGISSVVVSCAAVVEIAKIHRALKKKLKFGKKIVD